MLTRAKKESQEQPAARARSKKGKSNKVKVYKKSGKEGHVTKKNAASVAAVNKSTKKIASTGSTAGATLVKDYVVEKKQIDVGHCEYSENTGRLFGSQCV